MATKFPGYFSDLSQFLIHGKVQDYPVASKESKHHFGDKLSLRTRLPNKLTESEIFNVICRHPTCLQSYSFSNFAQTSRFSERMSYHDWLNEHQSVHHPNSPPMFSIASFWSTLYDGCAYHTEYRLISLEDNKPLKPLNEIYAADGDTTPKETLCGYCHVKESKDKRLLRCSGCKILSYCSVECQKKHWVLIHKKQCKKWKKKYKNKALTKQQIEDLCVTSMVRLNKLQDSYHGETVKLFKEMMHERSRIAQKEKNQPSLLNDDSEHSVVVNTMMELVIDAFDCDGDKKLNYIEWCRMMNELGLGERQINIDMHGLWNAINQDIGLIPPHEASLNNGTYGSYIHPEFKGFKEIVHGPHEIMRSLAWCAFIRSHRLKNNEDEDFMEQYDFGDEKKVMKKAFTLLAKLCGHAQAIICSGEPPEDMIYDAILDAAPYLNVDIASIIYNYATLTGQHIIHVSWHKIKWLNLTEDQAGLWSLYDRKGHQCYDIFYLSKQDDKGYEDTTIGIEICDDREKCNKKLDKLASKNMLAFGSVDMEERLNPKQRWCLGQCASYIPHFAFNLREHAILVGKVLEFHGLNPKLCHYIYVGVGVNVGDADQKAKIIDAFNAKYDTNTRYRPHGKKRRSMFNDMLNFG